MRQRLILIFIFWIALISCNQPCINATSTISLVNFPSNETDTVIVRKFTKSENFIKLIDTFLLDNQTSGYYQSNDTLQIIASYKTDNGLLSYYDYEIFLPEIAKSYKISEIVEEFKSRNAGFSMTKVACINPILSYKVNGQLLLGEKYNSTFYIRR